VDGDEVEVAEGDLTPVEQLLLHRAAYQFDVS